jgi:hypothetical protein
MRSGSIYKVFAGSYLTPSISNFSVKIEAKDYIWYVEAMNAGRNNANRKHL